MKLRDKRYSTVVADVRRSGWDAALEAYNKNRSVKVTKAQLIATLIADHKSRALRFRADLIAENETLTALRAGRHEGYKQLLDSGTVSEDQIERSWDATGDKKTRPDHMAMEGQQVTGLSVPFVAPDGSRMMFPGDTSMGAPAKQTIRCRCFERIRIRYIR
nr:phage minor head protein [Agrobacterium rubi]